MGNICACPRAVRRAGSSLRLVRRGRRSRRSLSAPFAHDDTVGIGDDELDEFGGDERTTLLDLSADGPCDHPSAGGVDHRALERELALEEAAYSEWLGANLAVSLAADAEGTAGGRDDGGIDGADETLGVLPPASPGAGVDEAAQASLETILTCSVCLEILFEPITATCRHSLCRACLRRLLDYDENATCPTCRRPLTVSPDAPVNATLHSLVETHFRERIDDRREESLKQDEEYRVARQQREEHDQMLEWNPLQLMFDNEDDPDRRRIMERDVDAFVRMGFTLPEAQKALFVSAGIHHEGVNWLIQHQHHAGVTVPWTMTQLQEQMTVRNSRRNFVQQPQIVARVPVVPGQLEVVVSRVTMVGTLGEVCWSFVSMGLLSMACNEVVFLVRSRLGEETYPTGIIKLFRQLWLAAADGNDVLGHGVAMEVVSDQPFLGDPLNTGVLFTEYHGQLVAGLPLPHAPYLFGILLRGAEIDFATLFPQRLLLRLGREFQSEYPFPLWSDRTRPPVFQARDVKKAAPLGCAFRDLRAVAIRLRTDDGLYLNLQLPTECHAELVRYLDAHPDSGTLPILTGVSRGADSHLIYLSHKTTKPYAVSLENSQAVALGASHCVLVCDKKSRGNGGAVRRDGLVMNLTAESFRQVTDALRRGEDVSIPASDCRRGGPYLSLRVQWQPEARISSGVGHHIDRVTNARPTALTVPPNAHTPNTWLALPKTGRRVECPELHPRVSVLGVGLSKSEEETYALVAPRELEAFAMQIIGCLNELIAESLPPEPSPASTSPSATLAVQVELHTELGMRFRISKDWADRLPGAPPIDMSAWSARLHALPSPSVRGALQFQISFRIA